MTYFVDFDRTLFDFDSFFLELIRIPELAGIRERALEVIKIPRGVDASHDERRNKMWEELHAVYASGGFSFPAGSLAHFVFPDAVSFLKKNGTRTVVVTKGGADISFQKGKVVASGVLDYALRCEYVFRDTPKGIVLKTLEAEFPPPHVFVDDFSNELDSVASLCPRMTLYEIRRDGKPGSGAYSVIRTLEELP